MESSSSENVFECGKAPYQRFIICSNENVLDKKQIKNFFFKRNCTVRTVDLWRMRSTDDERVSKARRKQNKYTAQE